VISSGGINGVKHPEASILISKGIVLKNKLKIEVPCCVSNKKITKMLY